MPEPCDMRNFPRKKYFEQKEIRQANPTGGQYEYTRVLEIRAEAETTGGTGSDQYNVVKLRTIMEDVVGGSDNLGIPRSEKRWDVVVTEYLSAAGFTDVRSAFDFTLRKPTRVVFSLLGTFWRFSETMAPFTTKHVYTNQYWDLRRHLLVSDRPLVSATEDEWEEVWARDYDCRCISFFSKKPCLDRYEASHGFSLNVDLLMDNGTLPITIDPDIENKGGNT